MVNLTAEMARLVEYALGPKPARPPTFTTCVPHPQPEFSVDTFRTMLAEVRATTTGPVLSPRGFPGPLYPPRLFRGMRVVEDVSMVDPVEDWSLVRSHARARRRRRRHPQRIRIVYVPKPDLFVIGDHTVVGHPDAIRRLHEEAAKSAPTVEGHREF